MNSLLRLFAASTLLLATISSFAASTFQGKVTLAMTAGKSQSQEMNYSIKGQKMRVDIDAKGHQMATIMDMDKLETTVLMPEQKMYMVMPVKKTIEAAAAKAGAHPNNMDVEVTGKTETILGYKCNQILVKDTERGTVTEMWVAEGLGTFMGMGSSGGSPFGGGKTTAAAKWEEALKGKGGFPLRVVSHDAKGADVFKMEATKIEPGTLSDSLFVAPAGYKQFQMPNMGDLLKNLGR